MITKYVLPVVAAGLLLFATVYVVQNRVMWGKAAPGTPPPRSPYAETVAGAGLVEAETENIAIGSAMPGVVVEVYVVQGREVHPGDPLFRLDDRQHAAELKVRQAALEAARADLAKLQNEPRQEQLPVMEAQVHEAQANAADQEYQFNRIQGLVAKGVATQDERVRTRQAYEVAKARLAQMEAQLALLKAGAWEYEKQTARAAVVRAESQVEQARTELERLVIRALVSGQVLQLNVRPGEFVGTPPGQPLIVLGNIEQLHVRVDIDEYDIPRFKPGSPARAMLRGQPREEYPMSFVRVEPYVIPKRSLTGGNTERVDTRVLQVIYKLEVRGKRFYVGQQLDVYIDAREDQREQSVAASRPAGG